MDDERRPAWAGWFPNAAVLARYQRGWARPDVIGGVTVAAMLVPQAMAYAELAGLGPESGFHAALLALVVYALIGSSRHLGVGPEPGTAVLAATGVGALAGGDPDRYLALMAALALVVGGVCLVAAALRLGFVASLLSKPVLVGYLTGVGLTLLTSQLAKLTGVPIDADDPAGRVVGLLGGLGDVDPAVAAVGLGTVAGILALRRWAPRVPGALVGVVAAAVVVGLAGLDVPKVGDIPAGLPDLGWPDVGGGDWIDLLPVALGVALVGYADNVLTGRSIAAKHGYDVDPGVELRALGGINVASGLSGGFPISSAASRSAVPSSLGSRTQVVSLVAAAGLALVLVAGGGVLAEFPDAAIAAVIVVAAIAIIDVAGFVSLWRIDRAELAVAAVTTLGVLAYDVLVGVAIAVALSAVVALARTARPHDAVLGDAEGLDGWIDVEQGARPVEGLLVYRFDAPLFFANADWYAERVGRALELNPGVERWVVLDLEGVGSVDTTALDGLTDLVADLRRAGIELVGVARANRRVLGALERAGLLGDGGVTAFPTINSAVRAFEHGGRGGG